MPNVTYRRLPDGNVTVDADGTCGKPFTDVVLIVEPESVNPGIQITSPSGIVGSHLLRQVMYDVAYGRHLDPDAPRPSVRVRFGSESTRRENPCLEEGELFEFDTPAEVNAFTEALAAADGYAEWEIIDNDPLVCLECGAPLGQIHKFDCGKKGGAGHVMEEDCIEDD